MPLTRLNSRTASSNRGRRSKDELGIENAGPNKLSLLSYHWALWYDGRNASKKPADTEEFKKNLQQLASWNTLQDFYDTWEQTESSVSLDDGTFFVFKDGIEPLWEDPHNTEGGQWTILVQSKATNAQKTLIWWNALVTGMILGNFGCEEEICGASLSFRSWGHTISLWNRNANDKDTIERVSKSLKGLFLLQRIPYQKHQNQVQKSLKRIEREKFEPLPTIPEESVEETRPPCNSNEEVKIKKKKTRRAKNCVEKIPPLADPISDAFRKKFKEDCLRYNAHLEGKGILSPLQECK